MKKLGGGANRTCTNHVGVSALTSAMNHMGMQLSAGAVPINHQHFHTSLPFCPEDDQNIYNYSQNVSKLYTEH